MELKELLDDYDVEYWTEGKNVSKGWINVQCPFCDDESNHLGLSVTDLTASCWKCGKKNIINVIKTVCDISYKEAKGLFDNLESSEIEYRKTKSDGLRIDTKVFENNFVMIPEGATKILPKLHRDYLRKRRFNYRLIQRKYKIQAVYTTGDYSFRIIIPIYKNNQLVSFTSRDVTKYADLRYRHASQEECILRPKDLIYGYGERPWNVVRTAVIIVLMFAILFNIFGIGNAEIIELKGEIHSISRREMTLNAEGIIKNTKITQFPQSLYFSLVTFTTLGYGDLRPLEGAGRIIAGLEALSVHF